MGQFESDVKILDISYINHTQKTNGKEERFPVLEIFGRTRDGESVTLLYPRFFPYFYILDPTAQTRKELNADSKVKCVEDATLYHDGSDHPAIKVTLYVPGDTPTYREKYGAIAADILFKFRFLYDTDLGYCAHVRGADMPNKQLGTRTYQTDKVVKVEAIEEIPYFASPLKIFSFDIENVIGGEILCIGIVTQFGADRREMVIEGQEKRLIEDFVKVIKEGDYDILSGYNVCNYDFPYIEGRAKRLGVKLDIGRNFRELNVRQMTGSKNGEKKVVDKGTNKQVEVSGRVVVDSWYFARKEKRPKRETLSAMAQMILGKDKLPMDSTKLKEEWAKDAEKVKAYCVQDTILSHEILEKIRIIDKYEALAAVARLPLFDVFSDRTSVYIDSLFIREADRQKVAVPNMRRSNGDDSESIEGGYVHEPTAGLYDRVIVFDFASLYPSVILQNNICTTTLSEQGTIVSPLGARFLSPDVKQGMLPKIMRMLLHARRDSKKLMKAAKDAKKQEESEYYDRLQLAQKILANAHFGVFSSKFYRFTDHRIGGSITAFAREGTKSIIATLKAEGLQVIYSDTDSLFLVSPFDTIEESVEFGEKTRARFSHGDISLEMEKIMDPLFLSSAKKRYFGKIVWPKEEILVRGFETRRGDSFDLQSRSLEALFEMILKRDPEGAADYCRNVLNNLNRGDVKLEDLVISKTAADESTYKVIVEESEDLLTGEKVRKERKVADSLAVVQATKKAQERGVIVSPGMKVSWIVVDSNTTPQRVEPFIDGMPFNYTPDYTYYRDRLLDSFLRILDVFGFGADDLSESRQLSLF